MKIKLLTALALVVFIASCKKDKTLPENEEKSLKPEVVIGDITSSLAGADSISTFINALKKISLTETDVAGGLTVFAPLNGNSGEPGKIGSIAGHGVSKGRKAGSAISEANPGPVLVTDSVLKDHIVKGVFKLTDLTDGKLLTGLSGKQLKITRTGDSIWVNGVQIGGKQIVNTNNEVVYSVKAPLTFTAPTDVLQTTSIEITVYDGSQWSTAKPMGELASGAKVELFSSQKNYADSVPPAYTAQSNVDGKAIFKNIKPGTYYISVNQNGKSNILNRSAERQSGLYSGYAGQVIFQTAAEVTAAPVQSGAAPGNFKWTDVNQDGKIDANDAVIVPYENAVATNGLIKKTNIIIGYKNNQLSKPLTEQQFLAQKQSIENVVAQWQKSMALLDGILSHDALVDSIPQAFRGSYQGIGNFSFGPTVPIITQAWKTGFSGIAAINTLLGQAPATMTDRAVKLAEARAVRAYIYLQLMSYFKNVPVMKSNDDQLYNGDRKILVNYIQAELNAAAAALPQNSSVKSDINALAVKGLLAKLSLYEKDYQKVADYTDEIIASAKYLLEANANKFSNASKEIIWNNSANMTADYKSYFYNRANLPYLRLSEIYLMGAEANISLGISVKANSLIAALLQRNGQPAVPNASLSTLRSLWAGEMRREGGTFVAIIRWGTASAVLSNTGFNGSKNSVLPIPQEIMNQYPHLSQNTGY